MDTNIHYPTDSSLLGDGVRVLTRVMKKVRAVADLQIRSFIPIHSTAKRSNPDLYVPCYLQAEAAIVLVEETAFRGGQPKEDRNKAERDFCQNTKPTAHHGSHWASEIRSDITFPHPKVCFLNLSREPRSIEQGGGS